MNFYVIEFLLLLSVVAGGAVVSYLNATNKNQYIKFALAFSGGFLLAVIFQHLLPELYGAHQHLEHADHAQQTLPVFQVGLFILARIFGAVGIRVFFCAALSMVTFMCTRGKQCLGPCLFHFLFTQLLKGFL